nr:MAG TPA: hypothetical protein [Caudoviricetes sp.]
MVRTINRQPYTVKQLDYGDVKYKFFNHSNWKGVCDDKNYLGVDQETFADSKNIYVDSEGILKSRPSVKQYIMTQQGLQYIYDVWTFGQWTVYKTGDTSLIFVKGDKVSQTLNTTNKDFRLILADEKIFVFEPNNLWYVDLTAETIHMIDGNDKIYVPVTEIVTKGVHTENESPNVLTTSYITRYLYEKGDIMFEVYGHTGTVKIGDDTYTITFSEGTNLTLVKKCIKLKPSNYRGNKPLVFVNKSNDIILLASYNADSLYTLTYSLNGIVYKDLPYLTNQIDLLPSISQSFNHTYAVLHKKDGPYAYTIPDTSSNVFTSWTNLIDIDVNFLGSYSKSTTEPTINFYPVTNDTFVQFVKTWTSSGRSPQVGDTIYLDVQDSSLSLNEPVRYKHVCVNIHKDSNNNDTYWWKTYIISDIATAWNYTANVAVPWTDTKATVAENLIGNITNNTAVLTSEELATIVTNPKEYDEFDYTVVTNSALSGASYTIYYYLYINSAWKRNNTRSLYEYNVGTAQGQQAYNKIREYFFDESVFAVQMRSSLGTSRECLLVKTTNGLTKINSGDEGICFCNTDVVCLINPSMNLPLKAYRTSDGSKLINLPELLITEGEDIYSYSVFDIDVFTATQYLQASFIMPAEAQSDTTYKRKLVNFTISYEEGTAKNTTNFKNYYSKTSKNISGTCTTSTDILGIIHPASGFNLSVYYNYALTDNSLIADSAEYSLLFKSVPIAKTANNIFLLDNDGNLYTSNFTQKIEVDIFTNGELKFDVFDHETELSQFFVSKGKNLYINAQGSNVGVDDFQWYFPERNIQEFDYEITNLYPISTNEIAVFLQDSIYYVKPVTTTINGIETIAYSYYKSRIPLGCEEGSDVITSYDNKYTMFVTKRGFVAMSYQDFIASDEQALTFLSDTIYDVFNKWNQGAIKLFQHNFWIILYRTNTGKAFIFDMRGNSWWPIEYNSNVKKFIEIDRQPLLLSGLYLYKLDKSNDNYFDGNSLKDGRIEWFLSSQKLHLNAINYYKHIVNLTFFGYNYGDKDVNVRFNLRVVNYRKQTDTNETKSFSAVDYKIQLTRTFVTRINYYKVNQVQYILESSRDEDAEDKIPVPLSLTAISLKYLVTGQVR